MKKIMLSLSVLLLTVISLNSETKISDLSGEWRLSLEKSVSIPNIDSFNTRIQLPGSIQDQNLGKPFSSKIDWIVSTTVNDWKTKSEYAPYRKNGNYKFPYWLQPETEFSGKAWYQREFIINNFVSSKKYNIFLERVHWESKIYINGSFVTTNESLCTPHIVDVTKFLKNGKNKITISVDNSYIYNIGKNSHSISDHTQGNWNGIIGRIELIETNATEIKEIISSFDGNSITVSTLLTKKINKPECSISCTISTMENEVVYSKIKKQSKISENFKFTNRNTNPHPRQKITKKSTILHAIPLFQLSLSQSFTGNHSFFA